MNDILKVAVLLNVFVFVSASKNALLYFESPRIRRHVSGIYGQICEDQLL